MRLSRPRVALRVALLAVGGAYMLWRALEARHTAGALQGPDAALASRLALVWGLMGVLALLTAATAALSLRRRRRGASLQLGGAHRDRGGREVPRPDSRSPPEAPRE